MRVSRRLVVELEAGWHAPAVITTHGPTNDQVLFDFAQASRRLTQDIASKGGFAVNCAHDGAICQSPASVKAAQWQFLKDHPFGVRPSPYADGLPPSFPEYCAIVR